jgi:hypothetical protein
MLRALYWNRKITNFYNGLYKDTEGKNTWKSSEATTIETADARNKIRLEMPD